MKHLIKKSLLLCLLIPFFTIAQINKPSLSPKITKELKVGLASVKIEYGQPSMAGRQIFGKLIPYGKLWRTGANSSTKISIDKDVLLAKQSIPAGSYGLYSIPGEKDWTIVIHKNTKLWGAGNYNKNDDLVRFKVPVTNLKDKIETLSIHFENFHANGGDLVITWEQTKIIIPLFVDSDPIIFKEIEDKIINSTEDVSAQTYFDAAQFYYHKNKNLNKAVLWFDKAIKMRPNAFWYKYYRAELAYHLKDYKSAKDIVSQSLSQAESSKSGDYGYIAKCGLLLEKINNKG
ncbi:DUF2911 domain-containing protein [Aquimarina sp. 2201CG5-10]|uniref:DUF2911 domain-containing protein n=1 Tax=Aquimarina callyspongiae TaxID=3098150 RepID=UPI002AB402FA|nr:DUF2911 domain-containing protein [Aquimarina sp. 2201CG5-10]MDY8136948.1 DUF2911 domain-containing protein [Aquimarina sp. 2201CG5-10]